MYLNIVEFNHKNASKYIKLQSQTNKYYLINIKHINMLIIHKIYFIL